MTAGEGKQASQWLAKVTEDQNLESLTPLERVRYDTLRRLFLSAILQPGITFGQLDPSTNRIALGAGSPVTDSEFTTASVASLTLTCPANRRLRVYYAACVNITQASTSSVTVTIGGNTTSIPLGATVASLQGAFNGVIGAGASDLAAGASSTALLNELWLEAGDSMTLTCDTFAGGNNTEHMILYEIYRTGA